MTEEEEKRLYRLREIEKILREYGRELIRILKNERFKRGMFIVYSDMPKRLRRGLKIVKKRHIEAKQELEAYVKYLASDCKDCDTIEFLVSYPELKSLWAIAQHFKLDIKELEKLNKDASKLSKGDTIYLPKGTLKTKPVAKPTEAPKGFDTIKFLVSYPELKSLWAIAQHFKLDVKELEKLNKDASKLSKGDPIYLPAGVLKGKKDASAPKPTSSREVAGDIDGKKIVLVSWTFDDGPVSATDELREKFKVNHATFFIVKSNMLTKTGGWAPNIKRYKSWIQQGATVAIHAQHKTIDHIRWFPSLAGKSYSSIQEAVKDLKTFQKELNKEGIYPKFVRPPGGLASQLENYASYLGFSNTNAIRNAIIGGKKFSSLNLPSNQETKYTKMVEDFAYLKKSLEEMGLFLWSGKVNPNQISPQSWEATSSGTSGMDDTVTKHVSLESERKAQHKKSAGKFERLVQSMKEGETKSLLILAHDTEKHIAEALADKATMEKYAAANGVRIEYVNLSELFKKVTGKDADKSSPDY